MYEIYYDPDFLKYLRKIKDRSIINIIAKRKNKLKEERRFRHLKYGLNHFVEEIGQYRLAFTEDNDNMIRTLVFVGTHKDYEKWLGLRKS